jgi:hypothetical protein
MKRINVTIISSGKILSAYKKDSEYQSWIDQCIASGVWGQPGSYTIEVVDATEELEQKRQEKESASKIFVNNHIDNLNNPHSVTKSQVGLGNVDNTSDASKPVSTATQAALDLKYDASNPFNYVDADGAGLAAPVQSVAGRIGAVVLSKSDVGLSNVPNTDATLRSNHTGTQLASTISDFNEAAQDAVGNSLIDSADINFNYPDVDNQISADLTTTGVVAGTYSLVTVDSKGRVTVGSNTGSITRFSYVTTSTTSNSSTTPTTVAQLTTTSLQPGLYAVRFSGIMQSGSATSGIGIRIVNGTATVSTVAVKWFISQGTAGTAQNYQYDQLLTTTNLTSASVATANSSFLVRGEGLVRVTSAGTLSIQIRPETNGTAASILADSSLILELA